MKTTHNVKFYRFPWNKENVEYLIKWWPHFGTPTISKELNIPKKTIKNKVNKLKLKLLSKSERICVYCKKNFQYHTFLYCKSCYNKKRRDTNEKKRGCKARFQSPDSNLRWISLYSNRTRMKTKTEKNRVDYEFMYNLWKKQNGQCYYSGLNMETPKKGRKRTMYAASIDRTDNNKGYTKDNVVWCCWFYNQAKSNLPQYEFIKLCSLVEHHLKNQQ